MKKKEFEPNWRDLQVFCNVECKKPKGNLVFRAFVPRYKNDNWTTLFQTVYFVETK